jgi:L-malate glycosyltransferase
MSARLKGRYVLLGDCESPHLVKWARELNRHTELYAASTRGLADAFAALLPPERCLALRTQPRVEGGNIRVLRSLPRLARWIQRIDPAWIHAHYLTSHGTLAWLSRLGWTIRSRLVCSAWGTDVLVTPERSPLLRWVTTRVLRASDLCTSDSLHMASRMQAMGAREVMTFPFGLDSMPESAGAKQEGLFFTNRALEPSYAPERVLTLFARIAEIWPDATLVVAHDGSLRPALERQAAMLPCAARVRFVGRLDAQAQAQWYDSARWYLSLPPSDSVSVSVLEAMAHGCVPLLSDLSANRELVRDGDNGLIVRDTSSVDICSALQGLVPRVAQIAAENRTWIAQHALFAPAVDRFVARLCELESAA